MGGREVLRVACLRLSGKLVSKTPAFIGGGNGGAVWRSLEYIPGSFIRGAFGVALIKAFCVKPERVNNHENCEARDGCPYFQLFSEDYKSSNIIFRYGYPEHVGCPKGGVYHPLLRDFCGHEQNDSVEDFKGLGSLNSWNPCRTYICWGCGHVASNPINLMRMEADGLVGETAASKECSFIEVIPPETPFRLDIVLALKVESCVDFVLHFLADALLNGVGRWKRMGFGRFAAKMKAEEIAIDDVKGRAEEIDSRKFAVRLLSPMAMGEERLLTPSVLLEAARRGYSRVFHMGKPVLPPVRLVHKNFLFEKHGGWSLKTERRRRIEPALSAGSVFQFECDENSRELALALAALEYYAVGAYKPHGCGQVVIEHAR